MKEFFIITNEQKDEGRNLTHKIQTYIREKGGNCEYGIAVPFKGRHCHNLIHINTQYALY